MSFCDHNSGPISRFFFPQR